MDPNATLEEIRALVARIVGEVDEVTSTEVLELAAAVQALDGWLGKGGALPIAWFEGRQQVLQSLEIRARRAAILERLVAEIAEECDGRADADCTGDPPRFVPNFAMQLLTQIRAVVPR